MRRVVAGAVLLGTLAGVSLSVQDPSYAQVSSVVFLQEGFEDSNLASRGWYDTSGAPLSTTEKYSGTRSLQCRFAPGSTNCTGGSPGRLLFQDTDSVYISFYVKHTSNWVGSGVAYHPHIFYFLTNLDSTFSGPAYTFLTAYVEENQGFPTLGLQDGRNIDEQRIGQDLTNITENRAVAGCNGDSDGYGNMSCYSAGAVHWNWKQWKPASVYFDSTSSSPRYKGNWHLVEAYFKLNSIVNGKGAKDGILRYWYDGALIMDYTNVVLRTGARATMKFRQLLFSPYIGDGSPVDQTIWFDDVVVATARPATPPTPPGAQTPPQPPSNVRIIR